MVEGGGIYNNKEVKLRTITVFSCYSDDSEVNDIERFNVTI